MSINSHLLLLCIHSIPSALSRQLEQAKISGAQSANAITEQEHPGLINELEDTGMGLGKVINHGEGLLASKEAELLSLREQERALEDKEVALDHNLDSTTWVLSISVAPPHDMNCFWADSHCTFAVVWDSSLYWTGLGMLSKSSFLSNHLCGLVTSLTTV